VNITICDTCGDKIPGGTDFKKHNVGNMVFTIPGPKDVCYYCACEAVYEAALKWKREADQSVEGKRRSKLNAPPH